MRVITSSFQRTFFCVLKCQTKCQHTNLIQNELNCEILSDLDDNRLHLELRWSVTEDKESILLQLVSSTGIDRYLALGIREDEFDTNGLIGGDVIVGWINTHTGKGAVDDYFLAGDIEKCVDGAESCPDSGKVKIAQKVFRKFIFRTQQP